MGFVKMPKGGATGTTLAGVCVSIQPHGDKGTSMLLSHEAFEHLGAPEKVDLFADVGKGILAVTAGGAGSRTLTRRRVWVTGVLAALLVDPPTEPARLPAKSRETHPQLGTCVLIDVGPLTEGGT